jgi:predicted HAD superfamily Cof-like phosphohydrolase
MLQVMEFNREILGITPRELGPMSENEFTHLVACLGEELGEFDESYNFKDFVGQIDSLIDMMYFALGGLYKMGLDDAHASAIFAAVHESNMTKRKGVVAKRDNGSPDAVKPEGWVSPEERISAILDQKRS